MAIEIVMPALGMAQETGLLVSWLKQEGDAVTKGEPIMEIETDKATVEIEAPASGTLSQVSAHEGDVVPVGQTIALILAANEVGPTPTKENKPAREVDLSRDITVSPVARKIAEEHHLDLSEVRSNGGRITKEDVLAHLAKSAEAETVVRPAANEAEKANGMQGGGLQTAGMPFVEKQAGGRIPASPKARRLAAERNIALSEIKGSGPGGAVIAEDVLIMANAAPALPLSETADPKNIAPVENISSLPSAPIDTLPITPSPSSQISSTWRVMAERMSESWTSAPHFYLMREVQAKALIELRERITPLVEKRSGVRPTYTDILVRLVAAALRDHPRMTASWTGDSIRASEGINIGLAVGIEDGLIVPVIHHADTLSMGELAQQRQDLVKRANEHKLRPADLAGGTFTITNLGMYNVDAFMAILNPPQAAILAVGRIADRVIPENGAPAVRPVMMLTLSCDHRVIDGLRAAKFLDDLTRLIEEPWGLLA